MSLNYCILWKINYFISLKPCRLTGLSLLLFPIAFNAQDAEKDSISATIQTVEIVGRKSQDYVSDYSFAATKIAMKNKDLPLTLNTVTKELINDRQAFRLGDVLKNVPVFPMQVFTISTAFVGSARMRKDRLLTECVPDNIIFCSR